LIPHEGRSIGSNDTNTDGLPAVRAPRINPACVATDRVEGRPHTTLLAFQAGPSASSGCVSTPALWGMSPSFDGDPRPGSLLRGRPSCLRNGPRLPALIRCWAANNPARHGDDRRRVGIWMLPTSSLCLLRTRTQTRAGGARGARRGPLPSIQTSFVIPLHMC